MSHSNGGPNVKMWPFACLVLSILQSLNLSICKSVLCLCLCLSNMQLLNFYFPPNCILMALTYTYISQAHWSNWSETLSAFKAFLFSRRYVWSFNEFLILLSSPSVDLTPLQLKPASHYRHMFLISFELIGAYVCFSLKCIYLSIYL